MNAIRPLHAAAISALCVATSALGQPTQIVTPQPASQSGAPGSAAQIEVRYTTSNADATLTGLGLRVHWDSTKLSFGSLANVLSTSLMAQGLPQPDSDDLDGDASTNTYVLVAWADTAGNWPGSLPVRLFTLNFTTAASFSGTTSVRFTASSTAAGYTLAATPATISAAPTGPTIAEAGSLRWIIPTSAHVGGLAGTNWVSDAVVHNPGSAAATANIYFLPSGQDNSTVRGKAMNVPAGQSLKLGDIVEDTFGRSSASGAILVGSSQPLLVTSRTYNNATSGTYGQYVAGQPLAEAISGTTAVRLIQLTKSANYRTNIGFANGSASSLPVSVALHRADGSQLGTRSYTVPPFGYFQETDIIGKVTSATVEDAYAIVSSTSADASYLVYASVIDNRTGDPITVTPVAAASISAAPASVGEGSPAEGPEGAAGIVTIFSDGFEGVFPGNWTVTKTEGKVDALWGRSTYRAATGAASAWCAAAGSAAGDPGGPYRKNMDTYLVYGPFSLADASAASVEFDLWLQSESGYDFAYWLISDGQNWDGWRASGSTSGWEHVVFDLGAVTDVTVIGKPQVWLYINFESDDSNQYEGMYVDNVVISKTVTACSAPAAPVATAPATATSGASYTVSWTGTSPDNSYEIEEAANAWFSGATRQTVTGTSRQFSHVVSAQTTYFYRVRARDDCGGTLYTSAWSNTGQTAVAPAVTGEPVYVPGTAALSGVGGTNWKTDLEVHNPGTTRAEFIVALLRRDQENSNPVTRTFTLEGGRSMRYENALQTMFSFSGAATLRLTPTSGSIMVTSRTYNDQPQGTYGQFTPGFLANRGVAAGTTARLVQLSRSSDSGRGFRTNLGLVNTTAATISLEVKLFTGAGTLLGTRTYSLRPYESVQRNDVFNEVGAGNVDDGFATVRCTTEGGRFLAFASVIDNRSGDPIYVPAR